MYYKAVDLKKGLFAKWRIAQESSARIAIGFVSFLRATNRRISQLILFL